MNPNTPEALERWKLEHRILNNLVALIEKAECDVCADLQCPADPCAIFAILAGEVPEPWPRRTAIRSRGRARRAMEVLANLAKVRRDVALGHENALGAAFAALMAGLHAGDAARNAALAARERSKAQAGGRARGRQIARAATCDDARVKRFLARWKASDELQAQYGSRSPIAYISRQTGLGTRAVQRALSRLETRQ